MTTGCATLVSLLLAACMLAAGCADPLARRTASFAAAGAPAITDTSAAFALVQSNHAAAELAQRVHAYTTTSLEDLRRPVVFGEEEDLRARAQVFALLSAYIAGLRTVTATKADTAAEGTAAAAGQAAGAALASGQDAVPAVSQPRLANAGLSAAAQALVKAEGMLAERARRRALPRILAGADPAIAAICTTLRRDIGTPDGPGLRSQVHTDYEQRIHLASAAVRDHPQGYSYPEREQAIRNVFALVQNERQADALLAQTDMLLVDFAATHHALTLGAPQARPPDFPPLLGRLALEATQLAAAEQALTTAGKDLP